MSSLLTNESSMVALSTLRQINRNLGTVQAEVSTGKRIGTARDNAAIWAVSAVMQSDVNSFESIANSLSLGSSTVAVARGAAEQVTSLLQEMKGIIVAAQEDNVDRNKLQTDFAQLRDQISSIANAAQFNGLNFLKGGGSVNILSSLDRASDGTVTASSISIFKFDLQTVQQVMGAGVANITGAATGTGNVADAATETVTYTAAAVTEGESFRVTVGTTNFDYVARADDTLNDVGRQLAALINGSISGVTATVTNVADPTATDTVLSVTNNSGASLAFTQAVTSGGTAGGSLGQLSAINISTDVGAASGLADIEGLIQTGIDASAAFGSAQKRIDIQNEFITTMMDSLKTGIGALTDTDMESASARLQSLQVQQQLGIQALSIANQQPQALLALFQ